MKYGLDKLNARRIDYEISEAKLINEAYKNILQSEAVKYVIGAMQPIDEAYTSATFKEGERVLNQLQKNLTIECEFEFQGSVTNDTHIKARSDIDLLTLIKSFYGLEPPQTPFNPYKGNPVQDLKDLRFEEVKILNLAFQTANIDDSGSKSICLDGGSLKRKIDVVPSNWYDTVLYTTTKNKIYRGVQILDLKNSIRIKNTPFLHNHEINERDKIVNGSLRKVARLMKSIKYDSDNVSMSSYDIVSIAYNIDIKTLSIDKYQDLSLLEACCNYCDTLLNNDDLRNSIKVPDGHRYIFTNNHATKQQLQILTNELINLKNDVLNENQRSFKKLEEARVIFG